MIGCMALSERGQKVRGSPEYIAREQQRAADEAAVAIKKAEEAVRACANDDISAFVMTHDYVRAKLKAPSTAKFPSITTPGVKTIYLGSCTHEGARVRGCPKFLRRDASNEVHSPHAERPVH
jgi:hypothetical protein